MLATTSALCCSKKATTTTLLSQTQHSLFSPSCSSSLGCLRGGFLCFPFYLGLTPWPLSPLFLAVWPKPPHSHTHTPLLFPPYGRPHIYLPLLYLQKLHIPFLYDAKNVRPTWNSAAFWRPSQWLVLKMCFSFFSLEIPAAFFVFSFQIRSIFDDIYNSVFAGKSIFREELSKLCPVLHLCFKLSELYTATIMKFGAVTLERSHPAWGHTNRTTFGFHFGQHCPGLKQSGVEWGCGSPVVESWSGE